MDKKYPPAPEGYEYRFVAKVTDPKTGAVRYAKQYGKRAFCILVPVEK